MAVSSNVSLSGLNAIQLQLAVTANNVANSQTDGFKKSRVVMQEQDPAGVKARVEQVSEPGSGSTGREGQEPSNVSMEEEMLNLLTVRYSYDASLQVIKTENEMTGKLLDIFK
jgi:flagellar hook protein FlgE